MQRNKKIFEGKRISSGDIIARAGRAAENFKIIQPVSCHLGLQSPSTSTWQPPPLGVFKINVDAAVVDSKAEFSVGKVDRDQIGIVLSAISRCFPCSFSPHFAAMTAVKEGVIMAIQHGWSNWIVETDNLAVVHAIKHPAPFSLEEQ